MPAALLLVVMSGRLGAGDVVFLGTKEDDGGTEVCMSAVVVLPVRAVLPGPWGTRRQL